MILDNLRDIFTSEINPVLEGYSKNRFASILVVIYGDPPFIVMTEKPKHMNFHAGEISFPGGKLDPSDSNLLETALRETKEEIGLSIKSKQVIGQLKPVVTLNSGFSILPFVSILDKIPPLSANAEVEKIFHIPLEKFLKTMKKDPDPTHHLIKEMYTFEFQNKIVWGASARVLKQIVDSLNF